MFININKRKILRTCIAMLFIALLMTSYQMERDCDRTLKENENLQSQIHILQNEIVKKDTLISEQKEVISALQLEIKSLKKNSHQKFTSPTSNSVGSFKSYMDYTAITNKSSPQFKLQQKAYTCEQGFRKIGEYYCVALGSYYSTTIGDTFIITLSTGHQFKAILSECKSDKHTDATNRYVLGNGNIIEFVIDKKVMNPQALNLGDLSKYFNDLKGSVVNIEKE